MPRVGLYLLILLFAFAAGCGSGSVAGAEVTIKLAGAFCEMYPDALTDALLAVDGVRDVDLTTKKGHALVKTEAGAVTIAELRDAVNGVKGEGWHCEAESID